MELGLLPYVIRDVSAFQQGDLTAYTFNMNGADLLKVYRIRRASEVTDGVQRMENQRHRRRIAQAMKSPDSMFLENLRVDLVGMWVFDPDRRTLTTNDAEAFLSVEAGGHRVLALAQLAEAGELQEIYQFSIVATLNLEYDKRAKLFLQEVLGRRPDQRLRNQLHDATHTFRNERIALVYRVALALNDDSGSPLEGLVIIREQVTNPRPAASETPMVQGSTLMAAIGKLLAKGSILAKVDEAELLRVLKTILSQARSQWEADWDKSSSLFFTQRTKAVCALLLLALRSNFSTYAFAGGSLSDEQIRKAVSYASMYKWEADKLSGKAADQIADGLNRVVGNAAARDK